MNRVFHIIILVLVSALCFILGRTTKRDTVATQVKEVVIIDTLRIETPEYIYRNVIDTMLVPIEKTTYLHDTLYIALPREVKVYSGDDYYAEVSGYRPNLDYLEVYPKTTTITQTITDRVSKNFVSAGIEAQYINSFALPIYAEYERMVHPNVGIYGRGMYDLRTRMFGVGIGSRIQFGW